MASDALAEHAVLAGLNAQQREAASYGLDDPAAGPLLIVAGAGTGKTNTLAHRVARLIAAGADPHSILLLTFSRRAAVEMTRRTERILAKSPDLPAGLAKAGLPWAGTFHGIGARLLREHADLIGLDPAFTVHDREDSADLMNWVRQELKLGQAERRFPLKGTCLAIYSRCVNTEAPLAEVLKTAFPWCAEWEEALPALFAGYVEAKQAQNVLDYDDLLLYWAHMVTDPAIGPATGQRFAHVLVDEYQDTNRLQASILQGLKPDGRGLTVVGDDAQSIYSFRGARVRNILDFPGQFAAPARRVTLEQNYRSTQSILAASNAVIGQARERFTKNLWSDKPSGRLPRLVTVRDDQEQARYVADQVLDRREAGIRLKAQAALFRTASHSAVLEIELARRNIPFVKFGGLKFLEAAHVKDLLSLLRWAENPRDRMAGFRVVQLLPGVGPKTAARLVDGVSEAAHPLHAMQDFSAPSLEREAWEAFVDLMRRLVGRQDWPGQVMQARQWYEPHLERIHADAAVRGEDLLQLERIADTYPSRERFLTDLSLDPPDATSGEAGPPLLDEDYMILSTIHSAKGQEWHSVYLLNAVDGCIPCDLGVGSNDDIEEERRLLYVAMTRAKDDLHLMQPQRFYRTQQAGTGDRHVYASRTRFIPPALLQYFQTTQYPPPAGMPGLQAGLGKPAIDIAGRMREMWKGKPPA
jgi:DNA helicase-2/ATP-dependent DNA helicase PcrA